ncbi:hypothetical protein AVEN_251074-1 [Araneus ventricosus]|uniref:Uncharacterized protein n=1 Tax=Araneus ventricosus TaxID=182803 RepID=A0A4Y2QSU6_ARAVE|nr:hypothetical protein AVEN_251074-1 [Araneus ventricosus]
MKSQAEETVALKRSGIRERWPEKGSSSRLGITVTSSRSRPVVGRSCFHHLKKASSVLWRFVASMTVQPCSDTNLMEGPHYSTITTMGIFCLVYVLLRYYNVLLRYYNVLLRYYNVLLLGTVRV